MNHPAVELRTIGELLDDGARRLNEAGVERQQLEVAVLARRALGLVRADLLAHPERPVSRDQAHQFDELLLRRVQSEPLAYVIGSCDFYGRTFKIDPRALIPRPETELLVELAIDSLRSIGSAPLVVDVGTGSGCIAISLALEVPEARIVAVDLSAKALALAKENLRLFRLLDRVKLVRGDLLSAFSGRPDLVAANLPYIPTEAFDQLPSDVRDYEPRAALDGGPGGMSALARLIEQAGSLGVRTLFAELDPRHAERVHQLARSVSAGWSVDLLEDLAGRPRLLRVR